MTEMHDVVEMLLNRIKDYPEDFVKVPNQQYGLIGAVDDWNKWREALNTAYSVATDEEKLALDEAITDAKRAIYMGAALKTIMSDEYVEEPTPDTATYKATGRYSFGSVPLKMEGSAVAYDSKMSLLEAKVKEAQIKMQRDYQNAINNA